MKNRIRLTDNDPFKSANILDKSLLDKYIEEVSSLLSSAILMNGGIAPFDVKNNRTRMAKWVRQTRSNFYWMVKYFNALNREYYLKFKRSHEYMIFIEVWLDLAELIPEGDLTKNPEYDRFEINRRYLTKRKVKKCKF